MAFTNLATKLMLNDMQVNSGPLGNGFPYLKFAWEIELAVKGGKANGLKSTGPLVAKSCELPRFSVETQVVNVYNHKTIVQTKMNYEPITMTFYDQTNNVAESLIWQFVMGQFDSPDVSKKPGLLPLDVKISMKNLSGEGDDKVYNLTNAFITDAQHDTLDYSTSDPIVWTITLRYEDMEISGVKDLEFKGPRKGDKGAKMPALPKPPSKPSVVAVPVTKPPKADAVKERDKWVEAGGTVTGGGAATGNPYMTNQTRLGNPNIRPGSLRDRAARANAERANGGKPVETAPWPDSGVGAAMKTSTGNSPSTGTATPPVVNKSQDTPPPVPFKRSEKTVEANKKFIKQEEDYYKNEPEIRPEYKKAYIEALKENPPLSSSPESRQWAQRAAEQKAQAVSPRYTPGPKPEKSNLSSDGLTLRNTPTSVNNNPSATNSQANKEQQYVKKTNKPPDY
jgi:hypothetical protein